MCITCNQRRTCDTHSWQYEEQNSTGVTARHSACCEPVLQKSIEQWGLHFPLSRAGVHVCWRTVHLYEEQSSIGVTAVTQCLL